jgi:hypothetical protein
MVSHSLARAGSTLRRHTWPLVLGWAATFAVLVALSLAFADRSTIDGDPQLIANTSFEGGLAPWEETGEALVERSIDEALVGRASARVEAALGDERYGIKFLSALIHPRNGDRYVLSAWVKGVGTAVGNRVTLRVQQRGGETGRRSVVRAPKHLRRSWTRVSGRFRIVEDDVHDLSIYLYVSESDRAGETFFADEIELLRVGARGEAAPAGARREEAR